MNLPPAFVKNILQSFDESGRQYLANLPNLLAEAARRWDLTIGEPFLLSYNYVCGATRADGTPAVLKIGVPDRKLTSEMNTLRHYNGQGACRLYASDPDRGMLLLERLLPGTMLHEYGSDDEQTEIAAGVMKQLWKPDLEGKATLTLRGWFDILKNLRPRFNGGTGPFPPRLVEAVEHLLPVLFAESGSPVILHGDCHHFNILKSTRGWLVIDPKGVFGPPEYEPAPLMFNPWDKFLKFPNPARTAKRRIHILSEILGFDAQRLQNWAICQSLLSAWWDLTENNTGGEYSTACGEVFLNLRL